jgi:hypothetical protein
VDRIIKKEIETEGFPEKCNRRSHALLTLVPGTI